MPGRPRLGEHAAYVSCLVAVFGATVSGSTLARDRSPADEATGTCPAFQSDSQTTRELLRRAQQDFERLRRRRLPRTVGYGSGPCDVRIGRLCYWDDDEPDWRRQPEEEPVAAARDTLIARLDSAVTRFPGDPWFVGQLVRYLSEVDRLSEAVQSVNGCRAERWWCDALGGFVSHLQDDYALADARFAASLAAMPDSLRCAWTDLSTILVRDLASEYRKASCEERAVQNERMFWLADPLYLVAGNERRTEHFARLVYDRVHDGTEVPSDLRWGEDNRELVLRYGWSEGWEQSRADPISGMPTIIGRRQRGGEHFMPEAAFVASPAAIVPDGWDLDPERPRERYAPRYASTFDTLGAQVAVFRRYLGAVVVAALVVPGRHADDTAPMAAADVGIVAMRDAQSGALIARDAVTSRDARLSLLIPAGPVLLSVEALNRVDRHAGRRRYWLEPPADPPERFGLSDLLLLNRASPLPGTLDEAIPLARPDASFLAGDSISIFWELYGPADSAPRAVSLVVIKEDRGFLRRAAEWLGLADSDKTTIELEWTDAAADQRRGYGRAVTLQLPAGQTGRFTIRLVVTAADGVSAVAQREIRITEDK